jgi:hypothetical protein
VARRNGSDEQRRVRAAVRLMKHDGLSASQATRRARTTTATLRRHYGDAIRKQEGRWTISGSYFDVLTAGRVIPYVGLSATDASIVGAHWRAAESYLDTGSTRWLEPFEGRIVADGYELETDPDVIDELADRDALPTDDIGDS